MSAISMNPRNCSEIKGFSLVELMIAITLGLFIVAATISIFSTNKQTYRATENLGRVQESARTAFELMSRDLREASETPCSRNLIVNNVSGNAMANWNNSVLGFQNGALAGSFPATDALQIMAGNNNQFEIDDHDQAGRVFTIKTAAAYPNNIVAGDIAIACDYREAAVFTVTAVTATTVSYGVNLGINPVVYKFDDRGTLARINTTQWYVAANGRGGQSLFRNTMRNTAGVSNMAAGEEVAEGVRDMQITYLWANRSTLVPQATYSDATPPAGGNFIVLAVRIALAVEGPDFVGTNGARLQRPIVKTINLRNRVP